MKAGSGVDIEAILNRSRPALARAITLLENDRPGASELMAELAPRCGRAHVVGITGAPGAGKSTLINVLLGEYAKRGRSVAVVAVDPSSPISGGSILGDRLRMDEHGSREDVFIRSVSARGHLGGLSRYAGRIIDVFDAVGDSGDDRHRALGSAFGQQAFEEAGLHRPSFPRKRESRFVNGSPLPRG